MLQEAIKKVVVGENLTEFEAMYAMDEIMNGKSSPSQIAAFLVALRMKGETVNEISGCAKSMRGKAQHVKLKDYLIDTCGTGGDGGKTFNISTVVAIIAASGGIKVAKHGNRAVSSRSGSADVLSHLGLNMDLEPQEVKKCIKEVGMGFMFAQKFHGTMKAIAPTRQELGIRTIFNALGPLTNPAFVKGQVLGVYHKDLTDIFANVLLKLGTERAMVVHGEDGLDEITTTGRTFVSELREGEVIHYTINPRELGVKLSRPLDVSGGDARENAEIILNILQGQKGPKRDIVLLNAAAALYIGKKVESLKEGVELSNHLIDSGKAYKKLDELIKFSRRIIQ